MTPPVEPEEHGIAALTELFKEAKSGDTPTIVDWIVADIDKIVREMRFVGWQETHGGEREMKRELRKTLLKFRLHQDAGPFERAYQYIREYYCSRTMNFQS